MTVLITLTTAGSDSGPFNLYSNLDGYTSVFEIGVSKASLLAGYSSTLVPDYTIIVRIKSIGVCTNYIDITLNPSTSTTTSTTTTLAPIISLSTACCKTGNCNDNATCAVHLPVTASNASVGYYIQIVVEASSDASVMYSQSNGYAIFTEQNALGSAAVRFNLYSALGGTIIATTGTQYLQHQSY